MSRRLVLASALLIAASTYITATQLLRFIVDHKLSPSGICGLGYAALAFILAPNIIRRRRWAWLCAVALASLVGILSLYLLLPLVSAFMDGRFHWNRGAVFLIIFYVAAAASGVGALVVISSRKARMELGGVAEPGLKPAIQCAAFGAGGVPMAWNSAAVSTRRDAVSWISDNVAFCQRCSLAIVEG